MWLGILLLWLGGITALAVGGAWLVRLRFQPELLALHNDVAGFIYAVLGVIYGVLLGFMVITVWEDFADADEAAANEAAEVGDLYRDAVALGPTLGGALQEHLRNYTQQTLDGWDDMESAAGRTPAEATLHELWRDLGTVQPQSAAEQIWYAEVLRRMNDLASYRTSRLHAANAALPPLMWLVLIAGAVLVIGFSYLFGTPNLAAHLCMVGILAAVIGLVLFSIYALDHPFRGLVQVEPVAFEQLEGLFRAWDTP